MSFLHFGMVKICQKMVQKLHFLKKKKSLTRFHKESYFILCTSISSLRKKNILDPPRHMLEKYSTKTSKKYIFFSGIWPKKGISKPF
jgi:hypothetical protein